jgi:class 3 adenylate cyclase
MAKTPDAEFVEGDEVGSIEAKDECLPALKGGEDGNSQYPRRGRSDSNPGALMGRPKVLSFAEDEKSSSSNPLARKENLISESGAPIGSEGNSSHTAPEPDSPGYPFRASDYALTDDETSSSSYCGRLWARLPPFIRPFALDPDIPWESMAVETHPWLHTFNDSRVAGEFARFAHRDLIGLVNGVCSIGGTLFMPLAGFTADNQICYPTLFLACALYSIASPAELLCHAVFENTVRVAYVRRFFQFVIAMTNGFVASPCSFSTLYLHCREFRYPLQDWGLRDTNLTDDRVEVYCRDIVSAFNAAVVPVLLMAFPFPPHIAILPFVLNCVVEILARVVAVGYSSHAETGQEIAIKVLAQLSCAVLAYVLLLIRYRKIVEQFRATIDVEIATRKARKVEEEVDTLLCAMLPTSALVRLSSGERVLDWTADATVLFSDMVSFTAWSTTRTPRQVADMLNKLCIAVDQLALDKGVEKVKTIGDAYWAVSGLPDRVEDHAQRICDFGNAMLDELDKLNERYLEWEKVELRVGVHSGEVGGGILGSRQLSYEVFGETSHLAEEIEKRGLPNRVCISIATLRQLRLPASHEAAIPALKEDRPLLTVDGVALEIFVWFREGIIASTHFYLKSTETDQVNTESLATASLASSVESKPLSLQKWDEEVLTAPELGVGTTTTTANADEPADCHPSLSSGDPRAKLNRADSRNALTRKLRQKFLASRTAMYMQAITTDSSSRETLHGKFSARKWSWFLLTFADPSVEEDYQRFVREHQRSLRQAARICSSLLVVVICICVWISGAPFGLASAILFPVAFAVGLLDTVSTFVTDRVHVSAHAVLHHVTLILFFFAAGMVPPGDSVATNDMTYLYGVGSVILNTGNCGPISSVLLLSFNTIVLIPITIFLTWNAIPVFHDMLWILQSSSVLAFVVFGMEKRFRQQFLDHSVETMRHAEQHRRNAEQYALLASVVPEYVVPSLMEWFDTQMDPARTIVVHYPLVNVAFVLLRQCESREQFQSPQLTPLLRRPHSADVVDTTPVWTGSRDVSDHLKGFEWLLASHHAVDRVLALFKAIDKIKTIGDVVMIAGPFTDEHNPSTAASQLLRAIQTIRATVCPDLKAGLHSGELVAGVLGTNRLCFDIFGDAVNVASRAMTNSAIGEINATAEFLHTLNCSPLNNESSTRSEPVARVQSEPHQPNAGIPQLTNLTGEDASSPPADLPLSASPIHSKSHDRSFVFGPGILIEAKGKGQILIHPLILSADQ